MTICFWHCKRLQLMYSEPAKICFNLYFFIIFFPEWWQSVAHRSCNGTAEIGSDFTWITTDRHGIEKSAKWRYRTYYLSKRNLHIIIPLYILISNFNITHIFVFKFGFLISNCQILIKVLLLTSKNETTNTPIHEFKVLHKAQRAF